MPFVIDEKGAFASHLNLRCKNAGANSGSGGGGGRNRGSGGDDNQSSLESRQGSPNASTLVL